MENIPLSHLSRPQLVNLLLRIVDLLSQPVQPIQPELNAGLVVIFGSSHPPLFNWADWTHRCRLLPDSQLDSVLTTAAEEVEQSFLVLLTGFLQRTLTMQDLTPGEMQCWIQSGLVLSPLVATCTQYSVDFCLA